jgi:hypothetical protein
MLSKCANPSCSTQLIYLREGKIFVMEHASKPSKPKLGPQGPQPDKPASRLEHFWLCGPCSENLTLIYHIDGGVQVVAKEPRTNLAAAS